MSAKLRPMAVEQATRMIWALPVAPGAGLVALLNVVANVPNPNYALHAIALPLVALSLSFGFSLTSLVLWAATLAVNAGEDSPERDDTLAKTVLATLIFGGLSYMLLLAALLFGSAGAAQGFLIQPKT